MSSLALAVGLLVAAPATADSTCWDVRRPESALTQRVNAARARHELGPLTLDPELSRVARKHTKEMIRTRSLAHTAPGKLEARVTRWAALAENVGAGGNVYRIHSAFMRSAAHRANVLIPSTRYVGVGTKRVGRKLWVTVVFEATTDPGTTLPMPAC